MTFEIEDFIQTRFGYCFYVVQENTALIYNLHVYPKYRRRGKARRLLTLVINEIRESGYKGEINIQAIPMEKTIEVKRLISFYTSMGLKILNVMEKQNV